MWQQTSKDEEVFSKNSHIKVVQRNYIIPNNPIVQDYYLLKYNDWVNIVALTANFKLLLVKQFRPGKNDFAIGIPAGNTEPNDPSISFSAKRELLEETGYSTELDIIPLFIQSPNNATHLNKVHAFLALNVKQVDFDFIVDSEIHEVVEIDIAEIFHSIMLNSLDDDLQVLHSASILFAINFILLSDIPVMNKYKLYLKNKLGILAHPLKSVKY